MRGEKPVATQSLHPVVTPAGEARLSLDAGQRRATGRRCASKSAEDVCSWAIANSTLTLFGAENVRSNAATLVRPCSGLSRSPVRGSQPAPAGGGSCLNRSHLRTQHRLGRRCKGLLRNRDRQSGRCGCAGSDWDAGTHHGLQERDDPGQPPDGRRLGRSLGNAPGSFWRPTGATAVPRRQATRTAMPGYSCTRQDTS